VSRSAPEFQSSAFVHVGVVEASLLLRGPASTDDVNYFLVIRRPYDQNEAVSDGADGDEAVFRFGMCFVKDLEVVGLRCEELRSFLEREAVLPPVLEVL